MRRLSVIIGAIGLTCLFISPALANSLVATSPIAGTTLKVAPSAITISVEITPMDMGNEITITDPAGRRVDDGTLTVAGNDLIVGMKEIKDAGIYKVSYNIISELDVPLVGSFIFNFSTPAISTPEEVVPTTAAKTDASNFGTNLFVIGLLLASLIVLIALALYARKIFRE